MKIISISTQSMTVSARGQVITVSLYWYDGLYSAYTRHFGVAFEQFRGRGVTAPEAVADLFEAVSLQFWAWADSLRESVL